MAMGILYQIVPAPIESLWDTAVAFAVQFDEADMRTPTPHSKTQRDRDWRNGVLLIAGIVGLPVLLAAVAAMIWS